MTAQDKAVILIPSLHPDEKLEIYVKDLVAHGFKQILVIDDGSGEKYKARFEALKAYPECQVRGYPQNGGKGHALKYGITQIESLYPNALTIITADSDGQHTAEDCLELALALEKEPNSLILGSRDFSGADIPPKSRFGNRMTSFFFALLYGRWLPDTQTGLRAFSKDRFELMKDIPGERFEYEMNVLIHCAGKGIPMKIVPIRTIYLEENKSTHFRPLHDSMRIYNLLFSNFFRFASASVLSTLLDLGLFSVLVNWVLPPFIGGRGVHLLIFVSTFLARLCSALFNYHANKQFVFKIQHSQNSIFRYVVLVICALLLSAFLVSSLHQALGFDETLIKAVVDTLIFFANYRIQRSWVFREK